jgi:hypothetical protein
MNFEKNERCARYFLLLFIFQIPAEDALLKLLEGSLIQYEKLKFDEGKEVHPLIIIANAAMDLGWNMSIKKGSPNDEINGISVGTEEYLNQILK